MKKLTLILSTIFAFTYGSQTMATHIAPASKTTPFSKGSPTAPAAKGRTTGTIGITTSPNRLALKSHGEKEARLRDCVSKCTPSKCQRNTGLAKECKQLCEGHNTSLSGFLYKKCSMSASGIVGSGVSHRGHGKKGHQGGTSSSLKGVSVVEKAKVSSTPTVQASIPDQLAQVTSENKTWVTKPQGKTLAQRTASESISTANLYGLAETEMQLFGLNKQGRTLSHSSNSPVLDNGYPRSERLLG